MVNKKRAEYMKPVLDCGDIVSIQVPSQSRGACDHPWLPVMVAKIIMKSNQETQYKVCSRHGVLAGIFPEKSAVSQQVLDSRALGY